MSRYWYILLGLPALALASCSDSTTEPESPQPTATSTATSVLLSYKCGNTFRVQNGTASSVKVIWYVYKTLETGKLTLPPRPAGAPYSETFFTTRHKGTVLLFRNGGQIQAKPNGGLACTGGRLRVGLIEGVTGAPINPDSTYSSGAVVSYNFTATPGRGNVMVLLDSAFVPASGTITMDRDHALFVSSDSIIEVRSEDQPLLASARGLLTAADPVTAFQAHLQRVASLFDEVGSGEARQRLSVVNHGAFDPGRDDAAIRRLDSMLAGHVFTLGVRNGSPAPAQFKSARALAAEGSAPSAEDSVTFLYVNGILTTEPEVSGALVELRAVVQEVIADVSTQDIQLFYNRNFQAQGGGAGVRLVRCLQGGADAIKYVGVLTAVRIFLDCDGRTLVDFLRTYDFAELRRQWLSVSGAGERSIETDAIGLRTAIQVQRDAGRHVIVTAHSQGNLMLQQAVEMLRGNGLDSANSSPCIGAMSLAAPTSANWLVDPDKLDGVVAEGDIILAAPLIFPSLAPNNFPRYETPLYLKSLRDHEIAALVNPLLGQVVDLFYAIALHGAVKSYFGSPMIRTVIRNGIYSDYASCVPAFVTITPSLQQLTLDQTGQFSATVMNRKTDSLPNRRITWTSSNPTVASVDSTGKVTALALGSSTVTATSGAVNGIGIVQVIEPSPFPPNVTVFGQWFRTVQNGSETCDHGLSISVGATSTLDCHNGFPIITRFSNSEEPPYIRVTLFGLAANPGERYRLALAGDGNTLTGTFGLAGAPNPEQVTFTRVQR